MIFPLVLLAVALTAIGHAYFESESSQRKGEDTTVDPMPDSIE